MDRIETLIEKFKWQYQQKEATSLMLGTLKLLEMELTNWQPSISTSNANSKVIVVLPINENNENFYDNKNINHALPTIEKVEDKIELKLIMPDDLPEPSHNFKMEDKNLLNLEQPKHDEINFLHAQANQKEQENSINEKLKQTNHDLFNTVKETTVKNLKKSININDRFLFINELFRNDENLYDRSIQTINNFYNYAEAEYWINRELKIKMSWDSEKEIVKYFNQIVKKRFI